MNDGLGLTHAPLAPFATRHITFIRADQGDPTGLQKFDIVLGRLVFPHAHIHGRDGDHRLIGGQQQCRGQIIAEAMGHFCQGVGGGGRNQQHIGFARQVDVAHFVFIGERKQIRIDLITGYAGQCQRRDELLSAFGQDTANGCACFDQLADKFRRLVSGNTTGDDQEDAFGV